MSNLDALTWSAANLNDALEALARASNLPLRAVEIKPPPEEITCDDSEALGRWIDAATGWLGLEAESTEISYAKVQQLLRSATPALFRVPGSGVGEPRFLAVVSSQHTKVSVIAPDLRHHTVDLKLIRDELCRAVEAPITMEVERMLDEVGVSRGRRSQARDAILSQRLGSTTIGECWRLRLAPGASVWNHVRAARLPHRVLSLIGVYVVYYTLWLLSWWMIGQAALRGSLDYGWLLAWVLLLLTMIPFRLLATWFAALLAIGAGGLLKQRLLYGALRLEPEEIRHQGVGQLLGRVIEGDAVESLALSGGFLGIISLIELTISVLVLSLGAGGKIQPLLLLAWVALTCIISWRYFRQRRCWTDSRLKMTNDLVERMAGHRTRLAQERREHWHDGEDQGLDDYLSSSTVMDQVALQLIAFVPRGWLVIGFGGLAPGFVSGNSSPETLAVSLGGILLALRALDKLTMSFSHLAGAGIAWKQIAPLFGAAARPESRGLPSFAARSSARKPVAGQTVIEAHDLVFRYRERGEPVLKDCTLRVRAGERILLEGSSGGGKSTLASLLTGSRQPESGLLLLGGLDWQTLGSEGWRSRVVAAPQFHENHVLTESFAFNLLMGKRWPPRLADYSEAEAICRELGLGELLERMPAGFEQMIGESGWQLSHGERSRLYIARALLQDADLLVLDESFAALDPENLRRALGCVLDRAPTLLVIAHP